MNFHIKTKVDVELSARDLLTIVYDGMKSGFPDAVVELNTLELETLRVSDLQGGRWVKVIRKDQRIELPKSILSVQLSNAWLHRYELKDVCKNIVKVRATAKYCLFQTCSCVTCKDETVNVKFAAKVWCNSVM